MYNEGVWVDLLRTLRRLRQYVEHHADQREASSSLTTLLGSILGPLLQEMYAQDDTHVVTAELLRTLGERHLVGTLEVPPPPGPNTLNPLCDTRSCVGT